MFSCCRRQHHIYPGETSGDKSKVIPMKTISPVISCQELKELLRIIPNEITILETDFGKPPEDNFLAGHIPRAQYYDQLECTKPTDFIPRGLPDAKCFEDYLTRLGVSNTSHVILYDRSPSGFLASSRAWFVLKTYGVKNLSILNGGFSKWFNEVNEIESSNGGKVTKKDNKQFVTQLNMKMVRTFDQMLSMYSPDDNDARRTQVIDARPRNLFCDAGHIPGALNLPHSSVLDQANQCLKSTDELEQIFEKTGINLSKPAIYTCNTGTAASTLAFVAHLLGQKEFSVYIGAFTEWKQRAPADLIIAGDQ